MKQINSCPKGLYRIVDIIYTDELDNRLFEIGFLVNSRLYIIHNNSLGIQVRINRATYLLNEVIASMIYVELIED